MRSLRLRLVLLIGVAILAAITILFATIFQTSIAGSNKLFDYHMQQIALALDDSDFELFETYTSPDPSNDFDFIIQVWSDHGERVYQSRTYSHLPKQAKLGFSTVTLDNGDWRVYAATRQKRVIQIAQKMQVRQDRAFSVALNSLWPIIPVALLLFMAVWWVITSALSPLNRIGHDLANRNVDSFAPVSDAGVPREVSPLLSELNSLLSRVAQALHAQRQFVADAAHELRSPLTALKLQVQTLVRAKDEAARTQGIERLLGGVDRASRLVEQLLMLARQDPSSKVAQLTEVSLSACINQAIADVAPFAQSRAIRLQCDALPPSPILGDEDSLRIMIRNLIDNAVRYTGEQGEVGIHLETTPGAIILTIEDSGTGIPQQDRVRVFDRFYRVPGTSVNGSGLGLAIVKAIADRHKAALELGDAAAGGLAVKIVFPLIP